MGQAFDGSEGYSSVGSNASDSIVLHEVGYRNAAGVAQARSNIGLMEAGMQLAGTKRKLKSWA